MNMMAAKPTAPSQKLSNNSFQAQRSSSNQPQNGLAQQTGPKPKPGQNQSNLSDTSTGLKDLVPASQSHPAGTHDSNNNISATLKSTAAKQNSFDLSGNPANNAQSREERSSNNVPRLLPQSTYEMQKKFYIDKQEYQSVFRVIDKDNTGVITVDQVNTCLESLDSMHRRELDRIEQERLASQPQPKQKAQPTKGYLRSTVVQQVKNNQTKATSVAPQQPQAQQQQDLVFTNDAAPLQKQGTFVRRHVVGVAPEESKGKQPAALMQTNKNFVNGKVAPAGQQTLNGGKSEQRNQIVLSSNQVIRNNRQHPVADAITSQQHATNFGEDPSSKHPAKHIQKFPNGRDALDFDEFIDVIKDSCTDQDMAENYLVLAFSMFDIEKKGFIKSSDLANIFQLLDQNVSQDEIQSMIKIVSQRAGDKITFREFVDFFYKVD